MNIDSGEQGYTFSSLWLNRDLKEVDKWNIQAYHKRFDLLYERFLKIWRYPDVKEIFSDKENEINIMEAEKPKNKTLEYFIFQDEKIIETTFINLYSFILKKLFNEAPKSFLNSDIKNIIGLTTK